MTEQPQDEDLESCCPPPAEPESYQVQGPDADELLATCASALGHPTRVAILRLLLQRDQCICGEIVDELPYIFLQHWPHTEAYRNNIEGRENHPYNYLGWNWSDVREA